MDKETKIWLSIISVAIAITVILFLLLSGFDLSGLEIRKGFMIN